ncbi:MAG: ABC transporter permease subunit [Clostridia bacterium]|nr:ABC transporter permease subunit [Clostridia bacterium]
MNLDALVNELNNSKNRVFADEIFAQMDLLDQAKAKLLEAKEEHKARYEEEANKIIREKEKFISLNKGFESDHKKKIKDLKYRSKKQLEVLKKDYKEEYKQAQRIPEHTERKLKDYYARYMKKFQDEQKNNIPGVEEEKQRFIAGFAAFREKELALAKQTSAEKLSQLKETYAADVIEITDKYNKLINDEIENHQRLVDEKFKAKNKQQIKILNKKIKLLKIEAKKRKVENRPKIKALSKEYASIKKQVRERIAQIKAERANYAKTLNGEELVKFKNLEKLINQEMIARKKKALSDTIKRKTSKINLAYLFVAPAFLGALLSTIFPCIFMLIAAWFKLDLANLENSTFVGFRNFEMMFKYDTEFQKSLGNTLLYALFTFGLLTVVTIAMAAWLSKNTRIHNAAQTMVFTPHIASLVSVSIVWIALLNPNGIINQILAVFGIEGPGWLIQENTSLLSVSFVQVWKDIGYYVLIIIAGLQGIPTYVYEAAKLDKASKATTFFKITLPMLTPTLSFVFITKFINSFKVFAPIQIMTDGGPMGSSMVLSYWIYKVGRVGYNYGLAMAGAIILTIIVGTCTIINNRIFAGKKK